MALNKDELEISSSPSTRGEEPFNVQAASSNDGIIAKPGPITLDLLWAVVAIAGITIIMFQATIAPNDFWWHIRAGQWILDHGAIPSVDLFSFTQSGQPWAYQSWLMEIALYLTFRLGNLPLVVFTNAILVGSAYFVLLLVNVGAASGSLRWAALATLAAALGSPNWGIRPQIISVFLFPLILLFLERNASRQAGTSSALLRDPALFLVPVLFVLWANSHGGFVFGLALLASYLLAEFWKWIRRQGPFPAQLALVAMLSGLACLITPSGFKLVDYVLAFAQNPITRQYSAEFWSPTLKTLDGKLFFGFVMIWLAVLLASRYRLTSRETTRLFVFGFLALSARRNEIWFCMVAAPTLAASLYVWFNNRRTKHAAYSGRRRLNAAVLAAVVGITVLSLPWVRPYLPATKGDGGFIAKETPVAAVEYLCELQQSRRVFNAQTYGVYMIWACPQKPVFIDTRIEFYPPDQWLDYAALSAGRYDWQELLDRYGIDTLLLSRSEQQALIDAASSSSRWTQLYQDDQAVIFVSRTSPTTGRAVSEQTPSDSQ